MADERPPHVRVVQSANPLTKRWVELASALRAAVMRGDRDKANAINREQRALRTEILHCKENELRRKLKALGEKLERRMLAGLPPIDSDAMTESDWAELDERIARAVPVHYGIDRAKVRFFERLAKRHLHVVR